jgi:hypothetical protein
LLCLRKGEITAASSDQSLLWALMTIREIRDRRTRLPKPDKTLAPGVIRPRN